MNTAPIESQASPALIRSRPGVKYVVYEEHTLGYIFAELPGSLNILHSSVIRGGYSRLTGSVAIAPSAKIRPATEQDFEEYRVCSKGHELDAPAQS